MSIKTLKLVLDNGVFLALPALRLTCTWEVWQLWPLSNSVTSVQGSLGFSFLFFPPLTIMLLQTHDKKKDIGL